MVKNLNSRSNDQEKIGHQKHTGALFFFTHSVLLEKSQQDNSNHTLKDHQT
jgi:hypothetical protein